MIINFTDRMNPADSYHQRCIILDTCKEKAISFYSTNADICKNISFKDWKDWADRNPDRVEIYPIEEVDIKIMNLLMSDDFESICFGLEILKNQINEQKENQKET